MMALLILLIVWSGACEACRYVIVCQWALKRLDHFVQLHVFIPLHVRLKFLLMLHSHISAQN